MQTCLLVIRLAGGDGAGQWLHLWLMLLFQFQLQVEMSKVVLYTGVKRRHWRGACRLACPELALVGRRVHALRRWGPPSGLDGPETCDSGYTC